MAKTVWTGWCGFESDRPHIEVVSKPDDDSITRDGYARLYRTKKAAQRYYQDVRKVALVEVDAQNSESP